MKDKELLQIIEQAIEDGATKLDLSRKRLTQLPPEIGQLTTLTTLYLNGNQLSTLPAEIGQLTNLTTLDLSWNQGINLPPEIGQLTNLRALDLTGNQLINLPPEIGQLTNLAALELSRNQLSTLPAEIGQLTNLTTLYLSWNQGINLPPEIGQLTNLTILYLHWNQLSTLPAEIGQLTNLTTLYLYNNQLINLPPEICQLTNLNTLYLYNNQLINLPPEIGNLTSLTTLGLYSNQLSDLPPEIGQLTNLSTLNLSQNQLINLPPEIGQLTKLTRLDLRWNQLPALPPEIGQLTNLIQLYLSSNKLSTLPPKMGQLTNLGRLYLRWNKLRTLPPEIGLLTNLSRLYLDQNQLSTLPLEMELLTNLSTLELGGNLLAIPPEILSRTNEPATIIEYYLGENKKPLNEAKLVLVGQGRVGKTSLVKRLVENQFDEQERITEGIAIKEWSVTVNKVNKTEIKLNIWDFGGQEIMHATHQFFMTERTLYLLVLDAQRGEANSRIDYWLKLIQSFGQDSPIIVISNKSDLDQLFLNQRALREQYPTIKAFVDTSCKSGEGIAELQKHMSAIIGELEHVRNEIQATWLEIKAELECIEQDYIPYGDYVRLCQAKQINQEQEQRVLIRLLHDLGVVLSFQDDPRLSDTSVLNPAWVTGAVYKIINAKQVMQSRGVLEIPQLDDILDDRERYPRQMHLFVIDLMRKFELCFDLEGHHDERFLLPDLLPEQEPKLEWPADSLNFEYDYDFLPDSVISRLMVRMQRFIFQESYWRHGVVLVNNQNRALLKAIPNANQISISIIGEPLDRPLFWGIIREQFAHIHESIRGLNAKLKIPVPGHEGLDYHFLHQLHQKSINLYPIPAGDEVVMLNVPELLEGIKHQLPTERPDVVHAREYLKSLRLRVHPQDYYPRVLSLGELHYRWHEYTFARQAFVEAHQAIRALRGFLHEDESQVNLSTQSVTLYEMLVHCYLVEGDQPNAFEYAAVAKGRAFVNTLASARLEFSTLAQRPAFAEKLQQVRQKRRQIENLERQSCLTKDKRRGQQDVLLREEAQLWREMEREYPLLTATLTVPTLSVEQACGLAQELDATLVEYYRHGREGTPQWGAFVVRQDADAKPAVRYVALPGVTSDFLGKMVEWRNEVHLSMGRSSFADRRFAELYQAAVAPLGLKDDERVVIAPFERLHLLPLSAAYNRKTTRYFSETHTLSFVPCLTALYVLNEEKKTRAQVPKEAQERVERLLSVAYPGPENNYLPNVLEEARAIIKRLPKVAARAMVVTALHEEEATPDNVIKEAPNHHVIHFGCHGSFKSDKPEQSGLRLADQKAGASPKHGSYLTVQRIITELNLKQTRLATLAACLTGEVALRDGEEHVGLLQAMMTAGAQTVVASLWRVDDAATRALFEAFYFREANIHASAHAMKDASHLLRQQKKWTHPYYWAAFEVNGLTSRDQETTPPEWPDELLEHIIQDHKQSIARGVVMDDKLILANAEVLLKQMVEYRSEIRPALEQHPLPEQIAKQPIEPTKVGLAKGLLAMVANHPTLGADFPEIQGHFRHIDNQEHQQTAGIPPSLQKAGAGQNKMYDLRQTSIDILKQEYIKRPPKGQPSLLDQFWALWKK